RAGRINIALLLMIVATGLCLAEITKAQAATPAGIVHGTQTANAGALPGLIGHLISAEPAQAHTDDDGVVGFVTRALRLIGSRAHLAYKVATNQMGAELKRSGIDAHHYVVREGEVYHGREICPVAGDMMTATELRRRLIGRQVFSF
ncbi:MAG: hypothetical protein AAFU58_10095, partial [Pseudomonadota bacterium]